MGVTTFTVLQSDIVIASVLTMGRIVHLMYFQHLDLATMDDDFPSGMQCFVGVFCL